MKRKDGWICDELICRKFFAHDPLEMEGKLRTLHFCSLRCKMNWLKKQERGLHMKK